MEKRGFDPLLIKYSSSDIYICYRRSNVVLKGWFRISLCRESSPADLGNHSLKYGSKKTDPAQSFSVPQNSVSVASLASSELFELWFVVQYDKPYRRSGDHPSLHGLRCPYFVPCYSSPGHQPANRTTISVRRMM